LTPSWFHYTIKSSASGSRGRSGTTSMITTLNIKCPRCGQLSQLFLSTTVSVIILNCPSCRSPVMYFRRKIFLLDRQRMKKIARSPRKSLVSRLLEQLATADTGAQCTTKHAAFLHPGSMGAAVPQSGPIRQKLTLEQPEGKYITGDDCTNLRIELELCDDSKTFIDRL